MEDIKKPKRYKTIEVGRSAEIVEKKSRFIAHVAHVECEDEALLFIEDIKKKYWDARHNCHAFRVGLGPETARCSDDGEPAQTAGKPMLDVLMGWELRDTVVVVTRYFGGTLLGTGGLVRAYTQATVEGLKNSVVADKYLCQQVNMTMDYTLIGKLQYLCSTEDIMILDTVYTDMVQMKLLIPVDEVAGFEKKVIEATAGRINIEGGNFCYGANVDGSIKIYD